MVLRPDLLFGVATGLVAGAPSPLAGGAFIVTSLVELGVFIAPPALAGAHRARAPFCEQTAFWAQERHVAACYGQVGGPVVELLAVPIADLEAVLA